MTADARSHPTRYVNLGAARQRFGDRVDRLGRHLWRSDVLADRVVEEMSSGDRAEHWRALERGLQGERVPAMARAMTELLEEAAHVPAWVDWDACDRGAALLMRSGPLGGAVLGSRALVLGYASPGGNKPLVFSGRLKQKAARRVNETARFVQAVGRPGGMRPFAEGWQITLKVRLIHAQVRRMILASGRWKEEAWGLPINQHDMAGTTLLFGVSIVDGIRKLGMRVSADESESYVHLWRWVGRNMGVDPDVLPASEAEAMRLADLIAVTMGDPDQDSRDLTRALFESALEGQTTRRQLREARRNMIIGHVVCRELLGDELADKLAVPREPMRHVLPVMKRVVGGLERVARTVPLAERSAIAAGCRYWDRVVEVGLHGAGHDFPLPHALAGAAA